MTGFVTASGSASREFGEVGSEELDELADGALVDVAEGGVFADFDESDAWVLQEGSDELSAFFEGEAFFVGEVDGREVATAEDIDVEVKEDC